MSAINNGGPAFPTEIGNTPDGGFQTGPSQMHAPGMNLRDYFAKGAMEALIGSDGCMRTATKKADLRGVSTLDVVATMAYSFSDAMLRARERT